MAHLLHPEGASPSEGFSTPRLSATQLLRMPKADRDRYLEEAATHAAPLYEADLALPPEQRELTALSAIEDDIYDYRFSALCKGDAKCQFV